MSANIFSQETINAALEMILYADRYLKLDIKGGGIFKGVNTHKMSSEKAKNFFVREWCRVEWGKRESVIPFVEYIERAYVLTPRATSSPHGYFDGLLNKDGFRIRDGKLRRIVQPPDKTG